MEDLWNSWEVKPALISSVKTLLHCKEINELKQALYDILKTLKSFEYLKKEAILLSNFLYKHKRAFRHDKGFSNLSKMNQCLKRYFKLNFYEVVDSLKQCFPAQLQSSASHAYLPTRQMLKWVLFRLLPFTQIFNRLINLCKQIGPYFYGKLILGWSLPLSLTAFCITARVLITSKFLLSKGIEWYNCLYKYLPYLNMTADFLPNFKLPKDLKEWLGEVDLSIPKPKKTVDEIFEIINLVKENEDDVEVKIVNEKVIKLFEPKQASAESTIEKNDVEIIYSWISNADGPSKKRKHLPQTLQAEDLGVSIEKEVKETPVKKFKKNKKMK